MDVWVDVWMYGRTDGLMDVRIIQIDISVTCAFLRQFTVHLNAVKKSELHLT